MINILCVKHGSKYSADYVNKLYSMVSRNLKKPFEFYCYTEDPTNLRSEVQVIPIESDLEKWWLKLDLLNIFTKDTNILFDLDVVIMNPLERLLSVKTRTLSILYAQWKEGYIIPADVGYATLYNSSIMKWEGDQGLEVYNYFKLNQDKILFKYKGIDRYMFNENVEVDLLPTSIAYSYWKGVRYKKDTTPEKKRLDYEVCILNHNPKPHELIDSWIHEYWYEQDYKERS